jgi:hypothetical protein
MEGGEREREGGILFPFHSSYLIIRDRHSSDKANDWAKKGRETEGQSRKEGRNGMK